MTDLAARPAGILLGVSDSVERPTLRQVAALAGVSLKTASRALNNEPGVTESTREGVRAAAATLGFRVNTLARELRSGGLSSTVGLLVGDLANPFWSGMARGVEREVAAHGLRLVSASTDENAALEWTLAQDMLERRVRALLVVTASTNHDYLEDEQRRNVAVVFLDRPPTDIAADTVLLDNAGGARSAARHLLAHGHRRIAVVGDSEHFYTHRERLAGFRDEMRKAGETAWEELVRVGASDAGEAQRIIADLLASPSPPTAIFCLNNWITSGALRALARIPEAAQPALLGFDDLELGDLLRVSVISHDPEELGRRGAQAAMARVDGDRSAPSTVVLDTTLVPRGSGERPAP